MSYVDDVFAYMRSAKAAGRNAADIFTDVIDRVKKDTIDGRISLDEAKVVESYAEQFAMDEAINQINKEMIEAGTTKLNGNGIDPAVLGVLVPTAAVGAMNLMDENKSGAEKTISTFSTMLGAGYGPRVFKDLEMDLTPSQMAGAGAGFAGGELINSFVQSPQEQALLNGAVQYGQQYPPMQKDSGFLGLGLTGSELAGMAGLGLGAYAISDYLGRKNPKLSDAYETVSDAIFMADESI